MYEPATLGGRIDGIFADNINQICVGPPEDIPGG